MEKFKNKNLIFTFSLLVIFAFVLTMPIIVKAETTWGNPGGGSGGHYGPDSSFSYNNSGVNYNNNNNYSPNINYASANNPIPVIYTISPGSTTQCSGPTTLIVNGANFVPNSVVRWNGSGRATTYISSNRLMAELTENDICGSGNYLVTVSNPNPGGGNSNAASFAINKKVVAPVTTTTTNKSTTTPVKKTTTATTTKKTTDNSAVSCDTNDENSTTGTTNKTDNTSEDNSSLTGSAIFGSGSFMPTTLAQWLLLLILILLAIVLFRKLYAKKFNTEPLKHA